ncbi:MAG: hypothetical protein NTW30_05535 [Candidatus Aenigmarchaeota archaeon]|nr:hypothetical protein [Candidatus Aenigmarchaeota archaeon]
MSYKKYAIFLIVLIGLVLFLSFLLTSMTSIHDVSLSISGRASVVTEKDVPSAVNRFLKEKKVLFDVKNNNTCYWIIPGRDESGHFIEIQEFGREFGDCIGVPRNSTQIRVDKKFDMYSQGCVCKGSYTLEQMPSGLKVSKSSIVSTRQRLSLGLDNFIQSLSNIFTKKN